MASLFSASRRTHESQVIQDLDQKTINRIERISVMLKTWFTSHMKAKNIVINNSSAVVEHTYD